MPLTKKSLYAGQEFSAQGLLLLIIKSWIFLYEHYIFSIHIFIAYKQKEFFPVDRKNTSHE